LVVDFFAGVGAFTGVSFFLALALATSAGFFAGVDALVADFLPGVVDFPPFLTGSIAA
jgi:hypothetical protein